MDFFKKINEKLDLGWKYTDCDCPTCKKQVLYNPEDDTFHCIQCEKTLDLQVQQQPKASSSTKEEFLLHKNDVSQKKRNDSSAKLAQKLLEGYTMLEECCPDCLIPLMRPRKGNAVCVGCDFKWAGDQPAVKTKEDEKNERKEENRDVENKTKKKEIERNNDKPLQLKEKEAGNRENRIYKQEIVLDNIGNILVNISKMYKEKVEKACKEDSLDSAERVLKGPLEDLLRLQSIFLSNYEKYRQIEKL